MVFRKNGVDDYRKYTEFAAAESVLAIITAMNAMCISMAAIDMNDRKIYNNSTICETHIVKFYYFEQER